MWTYNKIRITAFGKNKKKKNCPVLIEQSAEVVGGTDQYISGKLHHVW